MAAAFGAGPVMDAFSVAFRIPNLARRLFGEGAQTSAFLPVFVRIQEQQGLPAAQRLSAGMFRSLGRLLIGIVLLVELLLAAVWWLAPLSRDAALLVEFLMWLMPYLIGICLAAQQSAVLHGLRQFGVPALLPVVLNLVWLVAIPLTFALVIDPIVRMRWLCASILLAGALQMSIPLVILRRQGFRGTAAGPDVRGLVAEVYRSMAPVLLGVTITQINTLFDSLVAWLLSPGVDSMSLAANWLPGLPTLQNGTASALYFGQRMYQFPLGLIGVGLGTVLFPQFARHASRQDQAALNRDLTDGLRLTLAVGLPAGIGLMLLASPATQLLFRHGEFTADAVTLTSRMIVAYGLGVPAFIGLLIVQRCYYAVGDRATPVRHGMIAMGLNIVLDVALLLVCGEAGLAWATSVSACVQFALATFVIQRSVGHLPWRSLRGTLCRTLVACLVMGVVCLQVTPVARDSLSERLVATALPLVIGGSVYLATAALIGLREPWQLLTRGTVDQTSQ
jgi:putative peptidoglycan lipid II flippase